MGVTRGVEVTLYTVHSCTSFDVVQTNETLIEIDAIVEETEVGCVLQHATGME